MSEGGTDAIDRLFVGLNIHGKTAVEIGFGLGGSMLHLAKQHKMYITGLEINPYLVKEACARVNADLQPQLVFRNYDPSKALKLSANSFDIVYSKGTLVHCQDKALLFNEIYRIVKPGGSFVINNWLSPTKPEWGAKVKAMCETEQLTLYAETVAGYHKLLASAGFTVLACISQNAEYVEYNHTVAKRLQQQAIANEFISRFGELSHKKSITGYQLIQQAMQDEEILVRLLQTQKPL